MTTATPDPSRSAPPHAFAPRVEALIEQVMAEHPRTGDKAMATYYEAVHQELAPLARSLEIDLDASRRKVLELAVLVRRLALALNTAAPESDLPAQALDYLNRTGVPIRLLRETDPAVVPSQVVTTAGTPPGNHLPTPAPHGAPLEPRKSL